MYEGRSPSKGGNCEEALRLPSSYRRVQGRLDGGRLGEEEGMSGRRGEGRETDGRRQRGGLRGRETVQALETDSEGDMSERLCF